MLKKPIMQCFGILMLLMLIILPAQSQHSVSKLDFKYENKNSRERNGTLYYSVQYRAKGPGSSADLTNEITSPSTTLHFTFNESKELKEGTIEVGIHGFGIPSRMSDYIFVVDPLRCFEKTGDFTISSGDIRMDLEPRNNVTNKILEVVKFKASDNVSGNFRLKFGVFYKEKPTSEWEFNSGEIQFNYVISGLTPCIEPQTQWDLVDQSDIQAVCAFIDSYQSEKCTDINDNAQAVYNILDDELFEAALNVVNQSSRSGEKEKALKSYIDLFQECNNLPNHSSNVQEAQRLLSELDKDIPPPPKDPDKELWKASDKLNTLAAYQNYLEEFPKGKYVAEAKSKILCLKPIKVTTRELGTDGMRRVEILLENVKKPRFKNTSIDDGMMIDVSRFAEEHILQVSFNTDGRFEIVFKDACQKDTIISFDNTLSAFWKFNQDSTEINFNIKNGRKPYRIDFMNLETDNVVTIIDSLMLNTFTLTRQLMEELGLDGTYEPNVKDADSWRPRTLPTLSIDAHKQPVIKWILTLAGSLLVMGVIVYLILLMIRRRKNLQ